MKKWVWVLLFCWCLSGCGDVATMETLGQVEHLQPVSAPREVLLSLPEEAVLAAANTQLGRTWYDCGAYSICLEVFSGVSAQEAMRRLTGFDPEGLTVLSSVCGDHQRQDWVWTAQSEAGELICRGALLWENGNCYSLCVMAPSEAAGSLQQDWNAIFSSFCLEEA